MNYLNFFKRKKKLPKRVFLDNPYNIPIHDRKDKNNCSSHAFAVMFEFQLSDYFKERKLIDVDDLWEKQLKYGSATELGDTMEDVMKITDEYGVLFTTDSGKRGLFKPIKGIEMLK